MRIVVTGGTGFIGRRLVKSLLQEGREVVILTRRPGTPVPPGARAVPWPGDGTWDGQASEDGWVEALKGAHAVVHLAGASIAGKRWTPAYKERIRHSRVQSTRHLVEALARLQQPPRVLVSGSAVGYYGARGEEEVTEADSPGEDFLAQVCRQWEREAQKAEALGLRVVLLRTGVVLGKEGGALPPMLLPFRFGLGGSLGSGRQWMPWIHAEDAVQLICFLMDREEARGPFNVAAPQPVTHREFSRTLGRVLRRPAFLPVPAPLVRLLLGEMAEALLLSGQRALPARALQLGFAFRFLDLEAALRDILR